MIKLAKIPNLTELTYRSIKQSVLDGTLGELSRLTEESLATQLGISKSPVREALNRLEAEGLVRIEARRGAYVRQFSSKEVRELYELRELLEVHAIDSATITPKLLTDLSASINRTKKHLKNGNKLEHIEEDMRFHGLITAATGNQELFRVLENVQQKALLCRSKSYELSATTAPVAHMKIYQALKNESKREARAAMREHIVFVRDRLLATFKTAS
ncbi:GntR family transcriptional regulator [Granulicella sp. S190]|uniref:GntR family transcriptional regulator n=1 Tax=Granulicella sp. S190 TaxID=1747226 RepID=UPI00131C60FC|nr:GntR family transcriptional regulator [Granulicella sp. S190]